MRLIILCTSTLSATVIPGHLGAKRSGLPYVTSVTKKKKMTGSKKQKVTVAEKSATCTGHHAASAGQPAKRARTDDASLLETSIDEIISWQKLNGDTVNLYFDYL